MQRGHGDSLAAGRLVAGHGTVRYNTVVLREWFVRV
jgi:hypothetical protein